MPFTAEDRSVICRIFEANPSATRRAVARMFERETGRTISRGGVYYARRRGAAYSGPRSHLTDAEREVLRRVVSEADRDTPCSEIALAFQAACGRRLAANSVRRFMTRDLGLPPIGVGRNCQSHRRRLVEARAVIESRRKLESAPVDRSVRPGRTSRIIA